MAIPGITLSALDKSSESQTLELKESFSNEALETIGAFANAQGGTLLIGVRDNGKIVGINLGAGTLEEWAQKIQAKIQPRVLPSITVEKENSAPVGVIVVQASRAPVSVDGRYYKRVGRTNQLMSYEEIEYRILESSQTSWDSQIEKDGDINDLDEALVTRFIDELNKEKRRPVHERDWQQALEKLELTKGGKPTRAAILLFGKNARRFHESAYIRVGRFKSLIEIIDDNMFDGPLFEQLEAAMNWFRDRLQTRFVIDEAVLSAPENKLFQRDVVWEYPLAALREGILNAICHRDYKADLPIIIRLFDDHVSIENSGRLPPLLTPADLLKEHKSYPHNKLIAAAFYNTGAIEKWGSGTLRIADALKAQRQPAPQFDTNAYEFKLTLYRSTGDKQIQLRLNERQIKALEYMRGNGKLTNSEYQALFGVSKPTASRDLAELAERGLITKVGKTGKGTEYIISG